MKNRCKKVRIKVEKRNRLRMCVCVCEHEVSAFVVLSAAFENPKIVRALEQVSASEMEVFDDTVDCFLRLSAWKRGEGVKEEKVEKEEEEGVVAKGSRAK